MSEYKLTSELLKLSQSQKWDEAKLEWELMDIDRVEDPEECLCGHYPICEVCLLKNNKTGSKVRVGNCCVKKFNNKSDKIFRSVASIRKNIEKSVNAQTLDIALKNDWIAQNEFSFYMDILRKRKLTERQASWKQIINKKILRRVNKKSV